MSVSLPARESRPSVINSVFHVDASTRVCPQASCGRFQPGLLPVSVSALQGGSRNGVCRGARALGGGCSPVGGSTLLGTTCPDTRQEQGLLAGGGLRLGTGWRTCPGGKPGSRRWGRAEPGTPQPPAMAATAVRSSQTAGTWCLCGTRHTDHCWHPWSKQVQGAGPGSPLGAPMENPPFPGFS